METFGEETRSRELLFRTSIFEIGHFERGEIIIVLVPAVRARGTFSILHEADHRLSARLRESVVVDAIDGHFVIHDGTVKVLFDRVEHGEIDVIANLSKAENLLQDIGVILLQCSLGLELLYLGIGFFLPHLVRVPLVFAQIEPCLCFLPRGQVEDLASVIGGRVLCTPQGAAAHDELQTGDTDLITDLAWSRDVFGEFGLFVDRFQAEKLEQGPDVFNLVLDGRAREGDPTIGVDGTCRARGDSRWRLDVTTVM